MVGDERETPKRVYIIDTTPDKVWGWKIAKLLRKGGIIAERDIVPREGEKSVSHAREKGFETILVVEKDAVKVLKGEEVFQIPLEVLGESGKNLLDLI
ncbi:MAG TPA: hypothetical protein EYO62_04640 [Aquificales bacterium]|nr:hypothetical protein [Aquificales bacterium]